MLCKFVSPLQIQPLLTLSHGLKPGMGYLLFCREVDRGSGRPRPRTFEPPLYPDSRDGIHYKGSKPYTRLISQIGKDGFLSHHIDKMKSPKQCRELQRKVTYSRTSSLVFRVLQASFDCKTCFRSDEKYYRLINPFPGILKFERHS